MLLMQAEALAFAERYPGDSYILLERSGPNRAQPFQPLEKLLSLSVFAVASNHLIGRIPMSCRSTRNLPALSPPTTSLCLFSVLFQK